MERVKVGKIEKHINSTKQSYTLIGTHDVTLKEGSSIINPKFELKSTASFAKLSRCNYLEWESDLTDDNTVNYYWIDDISVDYNHYIVISCHRDELATFKSAITSYNGFVARSSINYDTMIEDPNILTKPVLVKEYYKKYALKDMYTNDYIFSWYDYDVSYTWTTIGTNGCSIFNSNQVPNATLYQILNLQGGSVWNNFEWGVTNPGQYVKDCIMLPFAFADSDYASKNIYIGNLTASVNDIYVWEGEATSGGSFVPDSPDRFYQKRMLITLSDIITAFEYPVNDFRNYSERFTHIKARIPFVGMVEIPPKHLKAHDWYIEYDVSGMTGKGKCTFVARYGSEAPYQLVNIGTYNIETGVPVAVAAGHTNQLEMARDAISVVRSAGDVVGAITKPTPAGMINTTANVMSTALETAAHAAAGYQEYTSFGSNGSLIEAWNEYRDIEIYTQQFASTSTDFDSERGRPVYIKRSTGNTAQYVQFLSPSVRPAGATPAEISNINNYMASGLYIEAENT